MLRAALIAAVLIAFRLVAYAVLVLPDGLTEGLCRRDCHWYLSIVTSGYDLAPHEVGGLMQANWAFFPLFPLLTGAVSRLCDVAPALAGLAVATLGLYGFALLGWLYRARTRPSADGSAWLLLLMAWPYGLYFSIPYSESLYAVLATSVLLALTAGRPWLAATASALLTATRPTGILLAAWIGLDRLRRVRPALGVEGIGRTMAPAILAPLGLLAFMAWLWWRLGDPLAFAHIQQAWGHSLRNPLALLAESFGDADRPGFHPGHYYFPAWALLGLAAAALSARRYPAEAWLCGMTVAMALMAGSVWSIPRFVAANPAFLFGLADRFEAIRSRRVRTVILLLLALLQAVFVRAWFDDASVLI